MPVVAYSDLVPRQVRLGTPHPHAHMQDGTANRPYEIYDDLDDLNVNLLNINNDDAIMENAITEINAETVADIAADIIEGGRHGNPPDYTEPSYQERADAWFQAFSVMPADQRGYWFSYIRRFFNDELEQVVESRTAHIHARLNTAENDTVVLRRLLSRRPHATRRFDFDTRSLWTRRKFRKNDFEHMAPAQVKTLAKQLLRAADGDINHPIIRRNAVYDACISRFQSLMA
ncbi:hypothetical protein V8E36_003679 [Tilletia maclaganii]